MQRDELKGYLAGLRHAAALVREEAKAAEAQGWAMSRAISDRVRFAAIRIEGAASRLEPERKKHDLSIF